MDVAKYCPYANVDETPVTSKGKVIDLILPVIVLIVFFTLIPPIHFMLKLTFLYLQLIFSKLIRNELVKPIQSQISAHLVEFLAGKIKTGDILKKMNVVDVLQIEEALKVQQEKRANGVNIKIADVMVALGCIKQSDVEILIKLKEDLED